VAKSGSTHSVTETCEKPQNPEVGRFLSASRNLSLTCKIETLIIPTTFVLEENVLFFEFQRFYRRPVVFVIVLVPVAEMFQLMWL